MICPYNRKSETQTQQWNQEYDDESNDQLKSGDTVTINEFQMMNCPKEKCGAWHNGRCCYASVSLDNQ